MQCLKLTIFAVTVKIKSEVIQTDVKLVNTEMITEKHYNKSPF